MGGSFYRSRESAGFQNGRYNYAVNDTGKLNESVKKVQGKDNDLIIEDNTIYEIDRDCYERLKNKKRNKS